MKRGECGHTVSFDDLCQADQAEVTKWKAFIQRVSDKMAAGETPLRAQVLAHDEIYGEQIFPPTGEGREP